MQRLLCVPGTVVRWWRWAARAGLAVALAIPTSAGMARAEAPPEDSGAFRLTGTVALGEGTGLDGLGLEGELWAAPQLGLGARLLTSAPIGQPDGAVLFEPQLTLALFRVEGLRAIAVMGLGVAERGGDARCAHAGSSVICAPGPPLGLSASFGSGLLFSWGALSAGALVRAQVRPEIDPELRWTVGAGAGLAF